MTSRRHPESGDPGVREEPSLDSTRLWLSCRNGTRPGGPVCADLGPLSLELLLPGRLDVEEEDEARGARVEATPLALKAPSSAAGLSSTWPALR